MNDKQVFFVYLMVKLKKKNMPHFTEKKNNKHLIKLFGNAAISWNIVQVT